MYEKIYLSALRKLSLVLVLFLFGHFQQRLQFRFLSRKIIGSSQ